MPSGRIRLACGLPVVVAAAGWLLGPAVQPVAASGDAARHVVAGRAHAWLADLQERFPDRSPGRRSHRDAPEHVRAALADAGASDARIETLETGRKWLPRARNVLARVPGADPSRRVVLAAHHDTVGGAPGAIDDGGAVAVLVEAVRALTEAGTPPCDLEIAVFDGEESGLVGSKAHVDALGDDGRARVRAALAVELVGWTEDRLVVHTIPYGFAWDGEGIAPWWVPSALLAAGDAAGVPLRYGDPLLEPWYQPTVRLLGVATGSDAGAYTERGIPACLLAGSSLTSFYSGYHTHRDTMDLVSSERLDDAARVVTAAALELAARATDDPPREPGTAYLLLGGRTIAHVWLVLAALAACVPGLLAARSLAAERGSEAAWCVRAASIATAALAAAGDVAGPLCGVPLVTGAAFATTLPRLRTLVLLPAAVPFLVQAMVITTAATAFGFRWRGGLVAGALLALLAAASIGAVVLVRLHRPPRRPRQPV